MRSYQCNNLVLLMCRTNNRIKAAVSPPIPKRIKKETRNCLLPVNDAVKIDFWGLVLEMIRLVLERGDEE